jgi:hypothetical protein
MNTLTDDKILEHYRKLPRRERRKVALAGWRFRERYGFTSWPEFWHHFNTTMGAGK